MRISRLWRYPADSARTVTGRRAGAFLMVLRFRSPAKLLDQKLTQQKGYTRGATSQHLSQPSNCISCRNDPWRSSCGHWDCATIRASTHHPRLCANGSWRQVLDYVSLEDGNRQRHQRRAVLEMGLAEIEVRALYELVGYLRLVYDTPAHWPNGTSLRAAS